MAQRGMRISMIGCMNNCIREYRQKMRELRQLLTAVKDDIGDEIKEHLADFPDDHTVDEVLDDFFDNDHGMIKIGATLIEDLQKAQFGDFSKMQILKADTEEDKVAIKQIVDMLH